MIAGPGAITIALSNCNEKYLFVAFYSAGKDISRPLLKVFFSPTAHVSNLTAVLL